MITLGTSKQNIKNTLCHRNVSRYPYHLTFDSANFKHAFNFSFHKFKFLDEIVSL